jgi:LPS sulfotransferase NodH
MNSYLICATPRTGSSLLCGLLESTGVAGHPESYFRQPDEQAWAAQWGIASQSNGAFSYSDYVQLPADREISPQHRRLADELNTNWIDRSTRPRSSVEPAVWCRPIRPGSRLTAVLPLQARAHRPSRIPG